MDVIIAAEKLLHVLENTTDTYGTKKANTKEHLHWMLCGITMGYIQNEKAHRWLSFVQGVIYDHTDMTLEKLKEINKTS